MLSTVFFPELLTSFHRQYPKIAVVLEEYGSVHACNLVQDDTLDLTLVNMEQYNIDKFNKALLANDQVVFCVSDDHRLADKEVVTTKEMSKEALIFFNADSGIKGIPLNPPIRIKIGMIRKKGKYISDNMQKFLNFTRMYYREHPLIQKF